MRAVDRRRRLSGTGPGGYRIALYIGGWMALFIGFLVSAPEAGAGRFEAHTLRVDGQIKSVMSDDLDGDGRRELITSLCVFPPDGPLRRLKTYPQVSQLPPCPNYSSSIPSAPRASSRSA